VGDSTLQDLTWAQSPSIQPVSWLSTLTTVAGWKRFFAPGSYLTLFYISLAWVAVFCALFAYAVGSFAAGNIRFLWPLRVLRAIGSFSASVLYVPMLTLLLSNFQCQDTAQVRWSERECVGTGAAVLGDGDVGGGGES
jgi:hypothetical protein